jgi:hypothetical protein
MEANPNWHPLFVNEESIILVVLTFDSDEGRMLFTKDFTQIMGGLGFFLILKIMGQACSLGRKCLLTLPGSVSMPFK